MTPRTARDIVFAAWPDLARDAVRAAEYESALEGLDPVAVESLVSSLRQEGTPLPRPQVLRIAVLARQRPATAPELLPAPAARDHDPAKPRSEAGPPRRRLAVAMMVVALASIFALSAIGMPWAEITGAPGLRVDGHDVGGGVLAACADVVAVLASIIGMVYVWRRRSVRHLGQAFALLALTQAAAVACVLRAHQQIEWAAGDLERRLPIGSTAYRNARLGAVPELSVTTVYWQALLVTITGLAAAIYGLVAVRRAAGPSAWRGEPARRARRRWAIVGSVIAVLAGVSAVAIANSGPGDAEQASERALATKENDLRTAALAAARVGYVSLSVRIDARTAPAAAALAHALRTTDPDRLAEALATCVRVRTWARRTLLFAPSLGQREVEGQLVPLGSAILRQAQACETALDHVRATGALTASDRSAIAAADHLAEAAAGDLRVALGLPRG